MNRYAICLVFSMLFLVGCSKDGAKARLLEGGQAPVVETNPTPTDINYPNPEE